MYIESGILGIVVGAAGTVLGGILAMLIGGRVREPRTFLAFAGGMMIAVVFFDMLIESTEVGNVWTMCIGVVARWHLFRAGRTARLPRGRRPRCIRWVYLCSLASHCTTCPKDWPSAHRS